MTAVLFLLRAVILILLWGFVIAGIAALPRSPARHDAHPRRARRADPDRQDRSGAPQVSLVLRYAARTDVGLAREGNEDALYAGPRLLAVADGMGGHAAGEVASRVVIES